jgi:hypothetical protein
VSNLTAMEKRKLERALGMSSGYVLNFSNRTFAEFFLDSVCLDIYDAKYDYASGSKANRMRAFWNKESNYTVGKLLGDIFNDWHELSGYSDPSQPPDDCLRIVRRLKESAPVPDLEAVRPISDDKDFEILAKSVRESIDRNEPETGLDRLHTFLVKYFRVLCQKHGISTEREKPLHSLVGEYVKALKKEGLIESDMTERILKTSISVMEAFNKVRNEQSYAHDNQVLNYNESLLIFGHVTSSIRFIEALESNASATENVEDKEFDDIPF